MSLSIFGPGLTTQQVAATVSGMITSSRLYTQMTVQAGDTLSASTTSEQAFASGYTIPANTLVVGQTIIVKGGGVYTTSALAPPTQRARLRAGNVGTGPVLVDAGAQSVLLSLSAARYVFEMTAIVRAVGVAGSIEAFGRLEYATSLGAAVPVLCGPSGTLGDAGNPVTVDTTQPIALTLTCTFGAVLGGNQNSLRQLVIHSLRPAV